MTAKTNILLASVLLILLASPIVSATWSDLSFQYRSNATVTTDTKPYVYTLNVSNGVGTNNATHIYCNSKCNSDFSDLRFYLNGVTPLHYWISPVLSPAGSARLFLNVTGNGTVSVYYNNQYATSTQNRDATLWFANFSNLTLGGVNSSYITVNSETEITYVGNSRYGQSWTNFHTPTVQNFSIDFEPYVTTFGNTGYVGFSDAPGTRESGSKMPNALMVWSDTGSALYIAHLTSASIVASSPITISPSTKYYATFERHGTIATLSIYSDPTRLTHISGSPVSYTDTVPVAFDELMVMPSDYDGGSRSASFKIYNVTARPYGVPDQVFSTFTAAQSITINNSYTGNSNLTFTVPDGENVNFQFIIPSETTYNWIVDGVLQAGSFNNTSVIFTGNQTHTVNASAVTQGVNANWTVTSLHLMLTLLTPVNGSTVAQPISFSWQEYPADPSHTLQIATDPNMISIVSTNVVSTYTGNGIFTKSVSGLTNGVTYYWRIKNNSNGFSPIGNFTTSAASVTPGSFNITVFDEQNKSYVVQSYTIDIYNTTAHLTRNTTNGTVNFTSSEVVSGTYLIVVTPTTGWAQRMVLATSPGNISMYVPNSTLNTIDLISFSLLDTTGLFPYTTSIISVYDGDTLVDSSNFGVSGEHHVYMIYNNKYTVTVTNADSVFTSTYVPFATSSEQITITNFNTNDSEVNSFVFNITANNGSITANWIDNNNVMSSVYYEVYDVLNSTTYCTITTSLSYGQSICVVPTTSQYRAYFVATMNDGTTRTITRFIDYSQGVLKTTTGSHPADGSPMGIGYSFNYGSFTMPRWVYDWTSILLIVVIIGSFGALHSGLGIIITCLITYFFAWVGWLIPLGEANQDVFMGIIGVLLIYAIIYYLQHKERGG